MKKLVSQLGAPEAVFKEKLSTIKKISGFKNTSSNKWKPKIALESAEAELSFIEKNNITVHSYWDGSTYPVRLKHCLDGPLILYSLGKMDFNQKAVLSVVGTRKATEYGKEFVGQLIRSLREYPVIVVSGLAYGIDIATHKACIQNDVMTAGVLAHGLDRIYPSTHKSSVQKMLQNGGVLTEFSSNTNPDRENFPKRNRIVAGMADATLVVESDIKGGSMITADIANSYNRDVFALPGDISHPYSRGCNFLIKKNKAALIDSPEELITTMGWEQQKGLQEQKSIQTTFFPDLNKEESLLVEVLRKNVSHTIDVISLYSKMPVSKVSTVLLSLEFKGVVRSLPGKKYKLIAN